VTGGERGSVPIEFALGIGVLVLPVAILVLVFPTWIERQSMDRMAAQEAARAVAVAGTVAEGVADGAALAAQIADNHDLADDFGGVAFTDPDRDGDGAPDRGGAVTATVTVRVPLTTIPLIGHGGGFTLTASHTEYVDAYRSLPGAP
jgi:Flp pilus assembly protein TadG